MPEKAIKESKKTPIKSADYPAEKSFGLLLRSAYHAFLKALEERISPYNVTTPQWFFLRTLWEEDGISQRLLSEKVGISESTTVAAIKVMERRGFVRCANDKSDKRRKNVFLTPAGRKLESVLLPHAYEVHMISKEGLSEEQIQSTRDTILHMKNNLEAGEDKRMLLKEIEMLKSKLKEAQKTEASRN